VRAQRDDSAARFAIELHDDSFERSQAKADLFEEGRVVRDENETRMPRSERPQLPVELHGFVDGFVANENLRFLLSLV
jgi:hypothetical protein